MKAEAAYTPLPSTHLDTPTANHSTDRPRPRSRGLILLLVPLFLYLSYSLTTTTAQLIFPADLPSPEHPFLSSATTHDTHRGPLWSSSSTPSAPRIAIIGAGAGGSSAAYFLNHFRQLADKGLHSTVTVFEKSDYIGERSTVTWPWNEDPLATPSVLSASSSDAIEAPVELGASIFVEANKNMVKAARVFGLPLVDQTAENKGMGIWDGEKFVFTQSAGEGGWGYWDIAKMFWRYGRSPLLVRSLVKQFVTTFVSLYSAPFVSSGPFTSLSAFSHSLNLSFPASLPAIDFFTSVPQSVSPLFTSELVSAATQVNYGTPVDEIHGLGALVSLAANGAMAVQGGNRKVFEGFLEGSQASVRFGKGGEVKEILKLDSGKKGERAKWVVKTEEGVGAVFDAVIMASPYHLSSLSVVNAPTFLTPPPQPYVSLRVTFIITNSSLPSPEFFNLPPKTQLPSAIFGTFSTSSTTKPTFNSLNYLKPLPPALGSRFDPPGNTTTPSTWHVVKMFSPGPEELPLETIEAVFGGQGNIGKVWRKTWNAYPKLDPVTEMETEGAGEEKEELAEVRLDEGFYYVNGFERLISTMETETVAALNVVSLLLQDFYDYVAPTSWAEWDN